MASPLASRGSIFEKHKNSLKPSNKGEPYYLFSGYGDPSLQTKRSCNVLVKQVSKGIREWQKPTNW